MEGVLEVRPERLETLYNQGLELPYVDFGQAEPAIKLTHGGEEYWYAWTLPLKGYSAALGRRLRELEAEERKVLLARFGTRIYIYATGIKPIGAGKPPGA
ncbi:MAG TPA: hypothetical protein VNL15_03880 [Dehalococcoidia bacterium]|nr:hypothetical protein [Dehalococcoidia bacterium]